jgi:hypothetical protein
MQLPGRLSASTLGDLLGALHRARTTGTLELTEVRGPRGRTVPGRVHRVHLRDGLVAAVETSLPVPPIGEVLRRLGRIGEGAQRLLVARIGAGDRRAAGEILAASGLASGEAVHAALRAQLAARIEALFALEEATVAFRTARPLGPAARVVPLGPGDFLHGRARARDRGRESAPADAEPRSEARPVVEDARARARSLLGIERGAAADDVRRAFRRLARSLHPDRAAAAPMEEQRRRAARLAELSAAYHLLVA